MAWGMIAATSQHRGRRRVDANGRTPVKSRARLWRAQGNTEDPQAVYPIWDGMVHVSSLGLRNLGSRLKNPVARVLGEKHAIMIGLLQIDGSC